MLLGQLERYYDNLQFLSINKRNFHATCVDALMQNNALFIEAQFLMFHLG